MFSYFKSFYSDYIIGVFILANWTENANIKLYSLYRSFYENCKEDYDFNPYLISSLLVCFCGY